MSGFKTIPRRRFLKGLGAAMALPMLDGMAPARAAAAPTPPVRAAFVFFPNGAIMPSWKPTGSGTDFELSQTLKPLEPFRSELNIFTGLAQDNGRAKGDGPGDHARCAASYLTGAHPVKTSGANIKVGEGARKFDDCRSCNPWDPFTQTPGVVNHQPGESAGLGSFEPLGRFKSKKMPGTVIPCKP